MWISAPPVRTGEFNICTRDLFHSCMLMDCSLLPFFMPMPVSLLIASWLVTANSLAYADWLQPTLSHMLIGYLSSTFSLMLIGCSWCGEDGKLKKHTIPLCIQTTTKAPTPPRIITTAPPAGEASTSAPPRMYTELNICSLMTGQPSNPLGLIGADLC